MGKGSTSTTTVSTPPPTETELELQKIQLDLAKRQVEQLDLINEKLNADPSELDLIESEITTELNQRLLSRLKGEAPVLSADQQGLLDTTFASATAEADENLLRFGEDVAASRGFSVSDSPIASSLLRERGKVGRGLASAKAGAALDISNRDQIFNENVRQFQQGLEQQRLANRFALAGAPAPGTGLGLQLLQGRLGNRTTTQSGSAGFLETFGTLSSGIGSILGGIGSLSGKRK